MTSEIKLKISLDGREALGTLQLTDQNIQNITETVKGTENAIKDMGRGIKDNILGGFRDAKYIIEGFFDTFNVLKGLFAEPVKLYVEREQAEASFRVLLGSAEAAAARMEELKRFAASTPFQLPEVIEASRMLQGMTDGALATTDALRMIGDVSAVTGKRIDEIASYMGRLYNAANNGGQGINELMVEMGKLGVVSPETMREVNRLAEAGATGAEMWGVLTNNFEKFAGTTAALADTMGGRLSNFQDSVDSMMVNVGGVLGTALKPFLDTINRVLEVLNSVSPVLSGFVGALGAAGVAFVMLRTAGLLPLIGNFTAFQTAIGNARLQFALASMESKVFAGSLYAAGVAAKGFFASLGPIGWVTVALGALTAAFSLAGESVDEVTQQSREFEAQKLTELEMVKEESKVITDSTATIAEKEAAIVSIRQQYPDYLQGVDWHTLKEGELAAAVANANSALERQMRLMAMKHEAELVMNEIVKGELEGPEGPSIWQWGAALLSGDKQDAYDSAAIDWVEEQEKRKKRFDDIMKEINKYDVPAVTGTSPDAQSYNALGKTIQTLGEQIKDVLPANIDADATKKLRNERDEAIAKQRDLGVKLGIVEAPKAPGGGGPAPGKSYFDQGADSIEDLKRTLAEMKANRESWVDIMAFIASAQADVDAKLSGKLEDKERERYAALQAQLVKEKDQIVNARRDAYFELEKLEIENMEDGLAKRLRLLEFEHNEKKRGVLAEVRDAEIAGLMIAELRKGYERDVHRLKMENLSSELESSMRNAPVWDMNTSALERFNISLTETEQRLAEIAYTLGVEVTMKLQNAISNMTSGMLNLYDITDAVKDGWSSAARGLASAGGQAVRVFKEARSVLQQFLNTLIATVAEAIIFKAVMAVLSWIPGFSSGGQATSAAPAGKADGGYISGPGGPRDDKILAYLSNGEYVMNAESTKRWLPVLDRMNSGYVPAFAGGGYVGVRNDFRQVVEVQLAPVEFRQKGMDLRAVVNAVERKLGAR